MPKTKKFIPHTEDVVAEIQDELPDLMVCDAQLVRIIPSKPRNQLNIGYYIHYRLSPRDVDRAVYIGDTVKEMKRNFDKWAKNWRV